ncbi:46002_t:CDS:2 [Gigaspora margarita]|uniref:46002_t:CDS:1 n=1 Tax=Gigaspora margarita TaxID=4874 RepID=A0ABN7VFZ9_GIGMA|nr:46002_t:CDS:2 [Gigaspora margarita]
MDVGNVEGLNNTTKILEIESDKENSIETFTVTSYSNNKVKVYVLSQLTLINGVRSFLTWGQSFEVLIQDFDSKWCPLVTNIWTQYSSQNHNNGNDSTTFTYQFIKHNQSSMRKEGAK